MATSRVWKPLGTFPTLTIKDGTIVLTWSFAPGITGDVRKSEVSTPFQVNVLTNALLIQAIMTPSKNAGVKLVDIDFENAAKQIGDGIEVALVRAFAEVESGGKSGFNAAKLPVIAFEGHRFRKYTYNVYDKSHPMLSYPYVTKAGPQWQVNNKNQAQAWATLRDAMGLDIDAALKSCSWGMFQVMGDNYATCGFGSVRAYVDAMKEGERGQLDAFIAYCKGTGGLVKAMKDKDFVAMATKYNGTNYGSYDKDIETAYEKYGGKKEGSGEN